MKCELDDQLRQGAERILATTSKLKGPDYGNSHIKRVLDTSVALLGLPIATPIIISTGAVVWANDGHWPFVELGNNQASGKYVHLYKLRTMVPKADEDEMQITGGVSLQQFKRGGEEDPRITRIGRIFRNTSTDNTPQVFNVLFGHLSLVGPRLPAKSDWNFIRAHQKEEPYHSFINLAQQGLKFGVTGMYFIMGRHNLADEDRYALEVLYWEQQSLVADLRIMLATVPTLNRFQGR